MTAEATAEADEVFDQSPEPQSAVTHSTLDAVPAADRHGGYNLFSIVLHWFSAVLAASLLVSSAAEWPIVHATIGLIAAPIFLLHLIWRCARGFPRPADEPLILSFVVRLTTITLLIALVVLAATGLGYAISSGFFQTAFGMGPVALPWSIPAAVAARLTNVHGMAATITQGALVLHVVFAGIHALRGQRAINRRIVVPVRRGS